MTTMTRWLIFEYYIFDINIREWKYTNMDIQVSVLFKYEHIQFMHAFMKLTTYFSQFYKNIWSFSGLLTLSYVSLSNIYFTASSLFTPVNLGLILIMNDSIFDSSTTTFYKLVTLLRDAYSFFTGEDLASGSDTRFTYNYCFIYIFVFNTLICEYILSFSSLNTLHCYSSVLFSCFNRSLSYFIYAISGTSAAVV